jgi:hypothetical protein
MTLDDLKSSSPFFLKLFYNQFFIFFFLLETDSLPKPAEMHRKANSNLVEDFNHQQPEINLNIRTMADPDDIYSSTLGTVDTSNSTVEIPNVRNGDGNLITPDEYKLRIEDGSIVMVNVSLKL